MARLRGARSDYVVANATAKLASGGAVLGTLTAKVAPVTDPEIAADVAEVFNVLTGYSRPEAFRKALVSPTHAREGFLREVQYVILDRDTKFGSSVLQFLEATGLEAKRTSIRSPWQNGIAERWVGSCRRELLDHVIPLNDEHLRRLVRDYVAYFHHDRIHDALSKDTPHCRPVENKPCPQATLISNARLGGLHHRYSWRSAA